MRKENILLYLTLVASPKIIFACSGGQTDLLVSYAASFSLAALFLTLIIVIVKSIERKTIYRGKLNIVLLILFIVSVLAFTVSEYRNRVELKRIEDCKKSCQPGKQCFCSPLC